MQQLVKSEIKLFNGLSNPTPATKLDILGKHKETHICSSNENNKTNRKKRLPANNIKYLVFFNHINSLLFILFLEVFKFVINSIHRVLMNKNLY